MMDDQELGTALATEFASMAAEPARGTLRARVLGIPDRGAPAGHRWWPTRSVTMASGRLVLLVALLSALIGLVWAIGGSQPATPHLFGRGSIAYTVGATLYIADRDGSGARPVQPGALAAEAVVYDFAFSPDGQLLAYLRGPGFPDSHTELVVVDAQGREIGTHQSDGYLEFTWAPTSSELALYVPVTTQLLVVGTDGRLRRSIPLPSILRPTGLGDVTMVGLAWTPDGGSIVVPMGYKEGVHYHVVGADGSGTRFLTADQKPGAYLALAPDGRLAVANNHAVAIVSADGSVRQIELPGGAEPVELAWAPDGQRIAVTTRSTEGSLVMALTDGSAREIKFDASILGLAPGMGSVGAVTWSADGRRPLLMANSDEDATAGAIWSVDPDGGEPTRVLAGVDDYQFDVNGAVAPAGRAR